MNKENESYLITSLKKVEKTLVRLKAEKKLTNQFLQTSLVYELIKEQVNSENTNHPTRTTR